MDKTGIDTITYSKVGYKLFRKRKNNTYGPLFINKKLQLQEGIVYRAESHPTKGFKIRPGWHICHSPSAPHLSKKDRVWCKVAFWNEEKIERPISQGGLWYIAEYMVIYGEI